MFTTHYAITYQFGNTNQMEVIQGTIGTTHETNMEVLAQQLIAHHTPPMVKKSGFLGFGKKRYIPWRFYHISIREVHGLSLNRDRVYEVYAV